jgi:hypothetical protein
MRWEEKEKDLIGANISAEGITSHKYDYKCFPVSLLSGNRVIIKD